MLNREYFVDQIKDIDDDSLVIFDSKGYDIERPECQDPSLYSHERYPICYNAGKGKMFNKILNTDREFFEYVDELQKLKLGWGTDEIYFGRCVNNKNHGVKIVKLNRGKTIPWITEKRIERHNFPITFSNTEEFKLNKTYGSYDVSKLINSYYIDAHCPRPYSDCKNAIDELVSQLSTNVSRIQYLYTNVDESNTYFKYKGEETEIEINFTLENLNVDEFEIFLEVMEWGNEEYSSKKINSIFKIDLKKLNILNNKISIIVHDIIGGPAPAIYSRWA
jgi:hypothetical protein